MRGVMSIQTRMFRIAFATAFVTANERPLAGMHASVRRQIAPGRKRLLTAIHGANESGLWVFLVLTRVRVALRRSLKPPPAVGKGTRVRTFARVRAHVASEIRGGFEGLGAVFIIADERPLVGMRPKMKRHGAGSLGLVTTNGAFGQTTGGGCSERRSRFWSTLER